MKTATPAATEQLRPILHQRIEQMDGNQLQLLDRILLQLEAETLAERLGDAFDHDQAEGKLQRVPEWVRQFRDRPRPA